MGFQIHFDSAQVPAPGPAKSQPKGTGTQRTKLEGAGLGGALQGIPGCPGLASELAGRAPHRRLTAAGARAPSWQGRFHSLAHAPGWEMIHENQEGKISPEAAE